LQALGSGLFSQDCLCSVAHLAGRVWRAVSALQQEAGVMEFSALETVTISMLGSVVTGAVVRVWMTRSFVTIKSCETLQKACTDKCELKRQQMEDRMDRVHAEHVDYVRSTDEKMKQVYRMLRGLIVFSDIPKDKQQEILNDRGV
jgi:hypothetical protein